MVEKWIEMHKYKLCLVGGLFILWCFWYTVRPEDEGVLARLTSIETKLNSNIVRINNNTKSFKKQIKSLHKKTYLLNKRMATLDENKSE